MGTLKGSKPSRDGAPAGEAGRLPTRQFHSTTVLVVRRNGKVVIAGDGQVTLGQTVVKATARKLRRWTTGASWPGSLVQLPTG